MGGETVFSVGEAAHHFGVPTWKVVRVYERGLLPPALRFGRYRVVRESDLPALEGALRRAGYLNREVPLGA
jgi:hypothetical protein